MMFRVQMLSVVELCMIETSFCLVFLHSGHVTSTWHGMAIYRLLLAIYVNLNCCRDVGILSEPRYQMRSGPEAFLSLSFQISAHTDAHKDQV